MLLERLSGLVGAWESVFPQRRTFERAVVQGVADLCGAGRHTLSQCLCFLGRQDADWSGAYRLLSRCRWQAQSLFQPVVEHAHALCGRDCVGVAVDDTKLKKTGRHIPGTSWHADPLSPPFHPNLIWGSRFMQASLLVPEYRHGGQAARGLPVGFVETPALRRPGKRASEAEHAAYRKAQRTSRLADTFAALVRCVRQALDQAGAPHKRLIVAADGSYCDRWGLATPFERTAVIARGRKDARLCEPATPADGRRVYGAVCFTPEQVRRDPAYPWRQARIFHGRRWRSVRYKEVGPVLWKGATRRQPLRLFVLAPTRYRKRTATPTRTTRKGKRHYYSQPAYLFCNNLDLPAQTLLQKYFDRWQIEVNHREEKDVVGIGQAQVRSALSAPRQPALAVAAYSALMLAGIQTYGHNTPSRLPTDTAWYATKKRLTANDLVSILRSELHPLPPEQRAQHILASLHAAQQTYHTLPNVQT